MKILTFIKRINPFRLTPVHPQALLHNIESLGGHYDMWMPSRRKPPREAMRKVIFPNFHFTTQEAAQEYHDAVWYVKNLFGMGYWRSGSVESLVKVCLIRKTPEVKAALKKLASYDFDHYDTMPTSVMMDLSVQLQIVLNGPSDHPDWLPPGTFEVDVREVPDTPLQLN